ncbi:MAG: hypothetical protein ACXAC6_05675 [Candidatus Hodarchaeales archaeon]|jgi:hypothetical protein
MKRKLSVMFLLVFILTLLPAFSVQAKVPLRGTMTLDFAPFAVWPEEPVWVGTIDIDGYGVYGMRFFHLTPFKDYSQASPFEEYFEIYNLDTGVVLGGSDVGLTVLANKPPEPVKYIMNGMVLEATGGFEEWLGRNVHMSGIITWTFLILPDGTQTDILVPDTAPGTFRIN